MGTYSTHALTYGYIHRVYREYRLHIVGMVAYTYTAMALHIAAHTYIQRLT